MRFLSPVLALLALLPAIVAHAQSDPNSEAVQRLAHSQDPALFVATGALYVKQEAIRANGNKPLPPELDAEVERVIDAEIRDPAWFHGVIADVGGRFLSTEEADEIATHFGTEGGQLQRRLVEQATNEVLINVYTFTDRIDYRLAGSEREFRDLYAAAGPERGSCACPTPREQDEIRAAGDSQSIKVSQDLTAYPGTLKFASGGAGVKYVKALMLQGIGGMTSHFEAVAKQVRATVASRR
jgi:hypothetical protein